MTEPEIPTTWGKKGQNPEFGRMIDILEGGDPELGRAKKKKKLMIIGRLREPGNMDLDQLKTEKEELPGDIKRDDQSWTHQLTLDAPLDKDWAIVDIKDFLIVTVVKSKSIVNK